MPSALPILLHRHRHRLKSEWNRRLHVQPPSTPLANPDILVHLMDETLSQLESLLRSKPSAHWFDLHDAQLGQLRTLCPCGLNPLMTYFITGEKTFQTVFCGHKGAPGLSPNQKKALGRAWHVLAQREIESLCTPCCRICAPTLTFPFREQTSCHL
jgi:hypothetical protein